MKTAAENRSEPKWKTIVEPARQIPVRWETDVLVVGGGAAGLAAAVSARRLGCEVALVERYGFLGGTLTAVTLGSFCGIYAVTEEEIIPVVKGFQEEVIERLKVCGGVLPPQRWLKTASVPYDVTALKWVADDLIREEKIRVFFHTLAAAVIMEGNEIQGIIAESKTGRFAVLAKVVIDASGDGDIAALAGVPFTVGDGGVVQAPSSMFRMMNVDTARLKELTRERLKDYLQQAADDGYPLPRISAGIHLNPLDGVVHVNATKVALSDGGSIQPLDVVSLSDAEMEGRRQVRLYEEVLRKYVPGFGKARVMDIGPQIGIRESRLIEGDYVLQADDILSLRKFEDAIACGAWPLEMHGAGRTTQWVWLAPGQYYTIPYRCLIPKGVKNMLVAGRNLSATHEAQASTRVSAVCMAVGQAAGTAAYLALSHNRDVRRVPVGGLRQLLTQNNAFLGKEKKGLTP